MSSISTAKKLSSGNPFLDHLLNGGYPISTIILIIEDSPTKLYHSLLKYAIAQGIVDNEKIFFYYSNQNIHDSVIRNLPYQSTQVEAILNSKTKETSSISNNNEMKIAWRYENINYTNLIESVSKNLKYIFDLSRQLQDNFTSKNPIISSMQPNLKNIISKFVNEYQDYASSFTDEDKDKYSRLILPNLFEYLNEDSININQINAELINLKSIARCLNGVTILTINKEFVDKRIINLVENISDYVFAVKGLTMVTEKEKVGDYEGIFYIEKRPTLCSLKPLEIETDMYGILRDKRKIIIEKIDIGVEVDRNTKVKESDIENNKQIKLNEKYDF